MGKGDGGKVIFPKCCFCIDLKTGVLVLGILSSIATAIALIAYLVHLAGSVMAKKAVQGSGYWELSALTNGWLATSIIGTIIMLVYFVSSILLSVGAKQEKPKLLIPWMIISLVNIVWCIVSIILVFVLVQSTVDGNATYAWGELGSFVISILLTVYLEIVVLSLYNKLNNPAPQMI